MISIKGVKARICIDPGHGGTDPGAVGPTGLREEEVVLKVSKELMYQLDLMGIDSELTRSEDVGLQLSQRVNASKDCTAFLSIHCNSHSSQAEGIETIYSSKAGLHKALANYVQQSMMKYFPKHKDRGIKMSPSMSYPRSLFVLTNSVVPSCLVELEFISNLTQEKWLASDETVGQLAHALAEGLKSYLMSLPGAVNEGGVKQTLASTPVVEKEVAKAEPELESLPVQDKLPLSNKKKKQKT